VPPYFKVLYNLIVRSRFTKVKKNSKKFICRQAMRAMRAMRAMWAMKCYEGGKGDEGDERR
jgi:hypothetical protein